MHCKQDHQAGLVSVFICLEYKSYRSEMFAGRCHHRDWVSDKSTIKLRSWGWGRAREHGRGLVTGGIASPRSLPRARRGPRPLPPPQKERGQSRGRCPQDTRTRSRPLLQRASRLGFCSPGVLLLEGGGVSLVSKPEAAPGEETLLSGPSSPASWARVRT